MSGHNKKKRAKPEGGTPQSRPSGAEGEPRASASLPCDRPAKGDAPSLSPVASVPLKEWPGLRWRFALWLVALGLVALFYLVIKAYSLNAYAGDEFIYLYEAKSISEGAIPYADFAMAHPPLQMLSTALLFKLFGFSFLGVRLLPTLWCLFGGLALAWMVRREYGYLASVVAAWLFLTAHEPLRAASHFTGVNMTVALLIAAVAAYRSKAIRTAAILSACAVFTRFYAAPGVLVLTVFALTAERREGWRLVKWGAATGAILFVAIGLWTGFGDMIHNLVAYHTEKTPMSPAAITSQEDKILFHNATIAALFALSLVALLAVLIRAYGADVRVKAGKRRTAEESVFARLERAVKQSHTGLAILSAAIAIFFLLILTNLDRIWMYYYIPSFPFAAVPAAWMIAKLVQGAIDLVRARGRLAAAALTSGQVAGGVAIVILFAVSFLLSPRLESRLEYFNSAVTDQAEEGGRTYTFPPSPLPDSVNDLVRRTLWQDERIVGHAYHSFQFVLWHESRVFDIVDEVVATIERETSKKGEIFGDSGTVPLFALLTNRRIAADEADTNVQRYRSGNVDPKTLVSKIDNVKTEMIILRANFGVAGVSEVRHLVDEKYRRIKSIRSAQGAVFHLYKRRTDLKGNPT